MEGNKTIKEMLNKRFSKQVNASKELERVTTGFSNIDKVINGLASGFAVIAARPCIGKTALALNMAFRQSVKTNLPVAYFSLDLSERQLADRLISIATELPVDDVRWNRKLDTKRAADAIRSLSEAPLFFNCQDNLTISALKDNIRQTVEKEKIKVVYVDNLEILASNELSDSSKALKKAHTELRGLAHSLNITIVGLLYTSLDADLREGLEGKTSRLSDVDGNYNGVNTDELADMVILPFRPDYYGLTENERGYDIRDMMIVAIAKNKYGPTGKTCLIFDKDTLCLSYGPNEMEKEKDIRTLNSEEGERNIADNLSRAYHGENFKEAEANLFNMINANPALDKLIDGLKLEIRAQKP